jgi:hypothetical protein
VRTDEPLEWNILEEIPQYDVAEALSVKSRNQLA